MSSFEDVVEEGGSDEFSDGIDDVSADESEGFYEEQNVHRMWRKASLSEEENDETDEDFGKGEAEKNEAEYEHFEDAISDREMEFRSIQSSLGSPKMPIINYGIPLDTSRYDSDSIEFFIMNCYCVVSAMPTSILDSVETALGEFLGENIYMKLSNFGYDSLETFLDDEMLSDFFIKERDAYDRAMYKAKPYPVYRNLISYFEERTLVEESRITAEEREKKFRLEETSRKNAIKCLKSRYDFLKMLRDCGGGSHAIDLPYFMQKYEMRKPNLVFGKKFWNEQFLSSSAKKTFAKHFSRDLIAQESESAMITLKFIRSFQECKMEIVEQLRRKKVDVSEIEAESEEPEMVVNIDEGLAEMYFGSEFTKKKKKSSSTAPPQPAVLSTLNAEQNKHMRKLLKSVKDPEEQKKVLASFEVHVAKERAKAKEREPEAPGTSRDAEPQEKPVKEKAKDPIPSEVQPQEPRKQVEEPKRVQANTARRRIASESESDSEDGEPLVVSRTVRNTSYMRLQEDLIS